MSECECLTAQNGVRLCAREYLLKAIHQGGISMADLGWLSKI